MGAILMDLFDEYDTSELKLIPVKNLGLKRKPWIFSRGRKLKREFLDDSDNLRAEVIIDYVFSDGNRVSTPTSRTINWYKTDGSIGLTKTDELEYSIKDLESEHRKIRQGRLDYMTSAAKNLAALSATVPEPYKSDFLTASQSVETILVHYETEIVHYIDKGTQEFEDAVRNETDPAITPLLDLMVRPPDAEFSAGLTTKQTILHQLTGEYNP